MANERYSIIRGKQVIFPGEKGKTQLNDIYDIEELRNNVLEGTRVIYLPVKSDRQIPKEGDIAIVLSVEQLISGPSTENATILFFRSDLTRVKLGKIEKKNGAYYASVTRALFTCKADDLVIQTLYEHVEEAYNAYEHMAEHIGSKIGVYLTKDNYKTVIDRIVCCLPHADHYGMFNCLDTEERLLKTCVALHHEMDAMEIDARVTLKVREAMDENQRDYYVREQIRALSEEIGDPDEEEDYLDKIDALQTTDENKEKFRREVRRLRRTAPASPDMALIKNYLDTVIELPWGVYTEDNQDLKEAERVLNADHYGIEKVKERLIEALAVRKLSKEGKSPIICLVGPPGTGKTSIARSIATAMNKKYVRLSFGGVRDEAEIRGHRKTYVGAMPGRIITSIATAGSMNPVFLMDEIDKMAADYKGDPASALLEVLDPEQNVNFRDHFLEIPFDLSKVLFITTANTTDTISRPLLDRMEIIEMSGYTDIEKKEIAKRYLIAKALEQNGVKPEWVKIDDSAIERIINEYTRESGVRALEKQINKIMRKVARIFLENPPKRGRVVINAESVTKYLGNPVYLANERRLTPEVGVVTGLAWTEVGGDTLEVEVAFVPGKGELVITGNLGDVMKESARIALTYCRAHASEWGVEDEFFRTHDIHLHVPEGATPKDGPSAGVTIVTAMCSVLTGKKAMANIAMTGEITLRGKILPIGGLKEKALAAMRDGKTRVYIPAGNAKDLSELPPEVRKNLEFVCVDDVDALLRGAIIW